MTPCQFCWKSITRLRTAMTAPFVALRVSKSFEIRFSACARSARIWVYTAGTAVRAMAPASVTLAAGVNGIAIGPHSFTALWNDSARMKYAWPRMSSRSAARCPVRSAPGR